MHSENHVPERSEWPDYTRKTRKPRDFFGSVGDMSLHQSVLESASMSHGLTNCFRVFCVFCG